jgi:hypothetical protein
VVIDGAALGGGEVETVSFASLLVTLPAALLTTTLNIVPSSAAVVALVV